MSFIYFPDSFTASRSALPGLKCGTAFAATSTDLPVLGLRPTLGSRWCNAKLPKPRISIRLSDERASIIWSIIILTASSTNGSAKCGFFSAMRSIKSDLLRASVVIYDLVIYYYSKSFDNNLFKYKTVAQYVEYYATVYSNLYKKYNFVT
ncbi:integration host factor beta subunit [Acinetobacter baumannii NCGM 237]|nr:integration host factor beta subunit [Acinetobacter baumannii NCGM 237]